MIYTNDLKVGDRFTNTRNNTLSIISINYKDSIAKVAYVDALKLGNGYKGTYKYKLQVIVNCVNKDVYKFIPLISDMYQIY